MSPPFFSDLLRCIIEWVRFNEGTVTRSEVFFPFALHAFPFPCGLWYLLSYLHPLVFCLLRVPGSVIVSMLASVFLRVPVLIFLNLSSLLSRTRPGNGRDTLAFFLLFVVSLAGM